MAEDYNEETFFAERPLSPPPSTDEGDIKGVLSDQIYDTKSSEMTIGRRVARFLSRYNWYNPHLSTHADTDASDATTFKLPPPSLDAAWEYFEYINLPRYLVDGDDTKGKNLVRAEPGEMEKQTRLYPVCGTNDEDMSDFGIGVGLYFNTLKLLTIITFVAGLISIPNMMFFASEAYEGTSVNANTDSSFTPLAKLVVSQVSAVCHNTSWEPCPDCSQADFDFIPSADDRLEYGKNDNGDELTFIKVNHCNITERFGIINLVILVFLIVAIFYLIFSQRRRMVTIDENQATSSDFSVEIKNPPNDARDPEVWKEFFESRFDGCEVRACTIALDNEDLVQLLIQRRQLILKLNNMHPTTQDFDRDDLQKLIESIPPVPMWKKILCQAPTPQAIYESILDADLKISEVSQKEYNVASVFVTFETEHSQRDVLSALSLPILNAPDIDDKFKFNGLTLKVKATEEPNATRWQDLNVSSCKRIFGIFLTTLASLGIIVGGAFIIGFGRLESPTMVSTVITIYNLLTPSVVSLLTSFESHPNESSVSASEYTKMTVFRWTNTAIIMTIITPFTDTLQDGEQLVYSVYNLFMFEIILTPLFCFVDPIGNIKRHLFNPRAVSQRLMNLSFKTSTYDIGEKYTNATKILFFALYYCDVFPSAFFFASATFFISYWSHRFCILRSWRQSPSVSATVSKFTNKFLLLCLIFYAIMSSYGFLEFPYDNACDSGSSANEYAGDYSFSSGIDTVTLTGDETLYYFCSQDVMRQGVFPPIVSNIIHGREWMNSAQETFSPIYGWSICVIVLAISFVTLYWVFSNVVKRIFSSFEPKGAPVDGRFTDIPQISGYIPQVHVGGYQFPFLLCDIDEIGLDLLGWDDPYHSYDHWNLIFDIAEVAEKKRQERELTTDDAYVADSFEDQPMKSNLSNLLIFSTVKDWNTSAPKDGEEE